MTEEERKGPRGPVDYGGQCMEYLRLYIEDIRRELDADCELISASTVLKFLACFEKYPRQSWIGEGMSLPHVSTDGSGGLSGEWANETRRLFLYVGANGLTDLHRVEGTSGVARTEEFKKDPTAYDLRSAVRWLDWD